MTMSVTKKQFVCQLCGENRKVNLRRAMLVRPAVVEQILRDGKKWDETGWVCLDDLQRYQLRYVQSLLEAEKGDLTQLEFEVLEGLKEHEIFAKNPEVHFDAKRTFGQYLADLLAAFGGSWTFIILFGFLLVAWMVYNTYILASRAFDPFPYILLNLCLSTLAALQAPVIMMSQNRQEARDRLRAIYDYKVNLKAELEI